MSILSKLFGGGKSQSSNPMNAANQYLNQIPTQAHETYDPFVQQGQESGANAHQAFDEMMKDPQSFINKIMGGYKESDAYKYQSDKLGRAMSNTAAAGGIAGTPLDQMNQTEALQQLLSGDQQQWLQNVLGRYDTGLTGEQNEATRGYDASQKINDLISGTHASQAGLAFNAAQQKDTQRNQFIQLLAQILGGAGKVATKPQLSFFGHNVWGQQPNQEVNNGG